MPKGMFKLSGQFKGEGVQAVGGSPVKKIFLTGKESIYDSPPAPLIFCAQANFQPLM